MQRRGFLASTALLAACGRSSDLGLGYSGGWVGDAVGLAHRLRSPAPLPPPATQQRCSVLVLGGGIAGLAAADALRRAGVDDLRVIELHDRAGGNSRGHAVAGLGCPLGAHYLPVPGPQAQVVQAWLQDIGVARHEHGRWVYDEKHLCHSPQERLFADGAWHEGLLPPADGRPATLAQYRRFAQALREVNAAFTLPTGAGPWTPVHAALDAQTFAQWLDAQGLSDTRLRWYLDYCCRDEYGADATVVSAWAGVHYFQSRHGFSAPGEADAHDDLVLTWPEGNAWLVQHLAAALGERVLLQRLVQRVDVGRHEVTVDLWNEAAQRSERWTAPQVVMALPLFVARRVLAQAPAALSAMKTSDDAPWLVATLALRRPLIDRPGLRPAWDNVSLDSAGLGYVHNQHQALAPRANARAPVLITAYHALPRSERAALLERPWTHWAQWVIDDLARTHADLPGEVQAVHLARHGHAMCIPQPGVRSDPARAALREANRDTSSPRLFWAHSDLVGYSVFEEAFTLGVTAAQRVLAAQRRR